MCVKINCLYPLPWDPHMTMTYTYHAPKSSTTRLKFLYSAKVTEGWNLNPLLFEQIWKNNSLKEIYRIFIQYRGSEVKVYMV